MPVAFIDLDRTLLRRASGPALTRALRAEGLGRSLPGDDLFYAVYNRFGENLFAMALARAAARVARGWDQDAVRRAGKAAVGDLQEIVAPYAPDVLAGFQAEGCRLVLCTTTPKDMIAPFAQAMGFDDVVATVYEVDRGCYTGRLDGGFVWGNGKLTAARRWSEAHGEDLSTAHACSDSVFDVPLLSSVGHPHAVNPDASLTAVAVARRWPIEHWDRPDGVPSILGLEPYHLIRPFVRPEMVPYADITVVGVEKVPREGAVILASNHRSYFDVMALAVLAAKLGRPVRFMAKRELFEIGPVAWIGRALGGIPVDRGSGSGEPLKAAEAALRAGEVVIVLPEGTIPRGEAFFNPVLVGKTGAARLAAATGAPVVPIGLYGTEVVWPRSAKVPNLTTVRHRPKVSVTVGSPIELVGPDAKADTVKLMKAIADLLPEEARHHREPTAEEMAKTIPSDGLA